MAYGEVQGKIWRSPSVRGLSDINKLAWSYVLYNQHSNMLGYYLLPLPYMADDLEWSVEKTKKAVSGLESSGLIVYDDSSQIIFICRYLKYNRLSSGARERGALARLENLPVSLLLSNLLSAVNMWHPQLADLRTCLEKHDSGESSFGVLEESLRTPSGDIVIDTDTDIVVDKDTYITKKNRKLSGNKRKWFEEFWEAFDYKSGKAAAADSWLDIKGLNRGLVDEIVEGAKKEVIRRAALRPDQTPKMAQGWLTDRRWEDDYTPSKTGDRSHTSGGADDDVYTDSLKKRRAGDYS